jgi:hypothetical protein
MKQQVIYSMLAMADLPVVTMAQVAQDEAIVTSLAQGGTDPP